MFDPKEAFEAQEQFCSDHDIPYFAPESGYCARCGSNIFMEVTRPDGTRSGIPVEGAGLMLITSCPHCHYSFCD